MSYIGKTPTIGNFQVCDAISVVNNQAAYTMQVGGVNVSPETANHMLVSLNGILQAPTTSFTVSGSTITFASNLVTGDVINFIQILGNVLDLGVPSDSTVSLAKLTATGTKNSTTFLRGDNTFQEISSDYVKIAQTIVTSSTASVTFQDGSGGVVIDSTYKNYVVVMQNSQPVTQGDTARIRIGVDGTIRTSGYFAEGFRSYYSGGTARGSRTDCIFSPQGGVEDSVHGEALFEVVLNNLTDANFKSAAIGMYTMIDGGDSATNQVNQGTSAGIYGTAEANNTINIYYGAGNIEKGTFTLYGRK